MNRAQLAELLVSVRDGALSPEAALDRLARFPTEDLGFARLDHHRALRQGRPEVIFAEGKTVAQVTTIAERLVASGVAMLATRTSPEQRTALQASLTDLEVDALARTAWWRPGAGSSPACAPYALVVSAGTSDLPVAREASTTLTAFGRPVRTLDDVGVAGLHRLLSQEALLREAAVVIVAAGMEGALASVVGGLLGAPVIAVPTSVGYGASFGGIAALLAMLNSCASGVTVCNIDNGFGAAAAADRILSALEGVTDAP
ncbi:MAG TPA: nickel pincer cofactor biosynthesis protein LarB [Gemmatimonadales bacterium]|nr:nickel pincer cofactor biosynthesis protein LarB [Gemmatimonadales bacterium]